LAFRAEHAELLEHARKVYGVSPWVIVAILGVETNYGSNLGRHRVIDALTTLGFSYPRRAEFFRRELASFFLLAREEALDPLAVVGSYAGAMGQPQFIASSYGRYAVDFDGDGYTACGSPPVAGCDCDDTNPAIHPDAPEICGNGIDEDCNSANDDCGPLDQDNDGDGYTENMGDCNDSNAAINPGATEICGNSVDEDCYDGPRECGSELTCVDYSEVPLETQARTAPPNVMFVLDDSGSMKWSVMTPQTDGEFNDLDNVFDMSDDGWPALAENQRKYWKSQWSGYNRIYYNPGTEYVPWPRWNSYVTGTPPLNADIDSPRSNPMTSTPVIDLDGIFMTVVPPAVAAQRITVKRSGKDDGDSTCADAIGLHPAVSGALG
ncbi:MAG: hypothetical protein EOM10_16645, partial [Opitutae bacterium]|nr:hypothetical protein [Opitutae bacterium]